ncbi:MAG: hypothetical protein EZS28_025799, partial [Streblomastix strix]
NIRDNAIVELNKASFTGCKSRSDGGGIYAIIESGGQLILDNLCEFYQCESHGNGGGIYIRIDFSTQCSFLIKDTFIHDCKAMNNTSLSYSQNGFGGGMFLGGSGDYNPISKLIDLHGMKIYNNSADKNGQSLFVSMSKIVEFCKYGILGEYVKGNYSDTYSDDKDLEGIPMNLITFNISTFEEIELQQQPLEPWWRILGILNRAQVFVNISNPNGKLIFNLEGQRMIPVYFKDGSSIPIQIEGEIPNDQKASFGMNDYKWLNYKEKVYAVLISNDKNIFTGKDGLAIEEDENAAVPLEVIIAEEEKGKRKGLPIGAIIGIVFGILAFIALIVIIIIIVVFASKKKKEKENKQQNNEQLTDLCTIVEPSQSSASNNHMSQIKTPPLSKVNSQVQSSNITNSQVRSYDITNTSVQPSNISYPKVQQTFITKSQVQPSNIAIAKAQPSIKPVSKVQSYYIPNSRVKMPNNLVKQQSISQTRLPPLNQQQYLVRTPPLNQQQSLVRTPPLNQQQSLVRTPPLNQQQSLVRTPPLNQQQSLVRTPPLNQQQSLDRLSPINDNRVLHQRNNGNLQTNNPAINRGVVSGKK